MQREDGKCYGFDENELAKKRAKYVDKTQYYAQYYNNPNRGGTASVTRDKFMYYNKKHVEQIDGTWYYKDRKLNIFASVDFAFSLKKRADYSSIVVIGVDYENNVYVLDIERFKTTKITEYFNKLIELHYKWDFRKARAEVTTAQAVIVNELRDKIKEEGIYLKIEDYRPTRHDGTKIERINATLEPRYDALGIYHYKGGWCQSLEEEVTMEFPPHDDIKDSLASAIQMSSPPRRVRTGNRMQGNVIYNNRFGGVSYV